MNVNLITPISVTISSAKLLLESEGSGTVEFKILDQPQRLSLLSTEYTYDTVFTIGCRVKVILAYGYFGLNSEGELKRIIIDSTNDMAEVYFDNIFPNGDFTADVDVNMTGVVSVIATIPLANLQVI